MAWCTPSTVLARTPPRWCSTRSTVAWLSPACAAISRTRNVPVIGKEHEGKLRVFQGCVRRRRPSVEVGKIPAGKAPSPRLRPDVDAPTSFPSPGWFTPEDCRLEDFRPLVEQATRLDDYPHADAVEQNVLIYGERWLIGGPARGGQEVQAELARALRRGRASWCSGGHSPRMVDRATEVFTELIEEQKATGIAGGDHFAKPGANDRIWGALDKFARCAPEVFAEYYANDMLALICEAWLGPNYQVTSQPNVVNPGGQAQVVHRDYHLGFMDREQALAYPAQAHLLSPALTLQGAVAHCDMPVESGPTMYLPHSQKYRPGYIAYHPPSSSSTSARITSSCRWTRGTRRSSTRPCSTGPERTVRPASSGWPTCCRCLRRSAGPWRAWTRSRSARRCSALKALGVGGDRAVRNLITVAAEGYPFPTNLDRDQPIGGMAPQTQAELLGQAVAEDWDEPGSGRSWQRSSSGGGRHEQRGAGGAGKIAGAPISWGVCEVPGWGYQLSPERVLAEMTQVGLAATELGRRVLAGRARRPRPSCGSTTWPRSAASSRSCCTCRAMIRCRRSGVLAGYAGTGSGTLVLSADSGLAGYDARPTLDEDGWTTLLRNLDRLGALAAEHGVLAVLHPHVGTMVESATRCSGCWMARRSRCAWTPGTC